MPYIVQPKRDVLDEQPLSTLGAACTDLGDLTYTFYKIAADYTRHGGGSPSYEERSMIMAALENTKLEFHRRFLVDYENRKALENGDV